MSIDQPVPVDEKARRRLRFLYSDTFSVAELRALLRDGVRMEVRIDGWRRLSISLSGDIDYYPRMQEGAAPYISNVYRHDWQLDRTYFRIAP